MTGDPLDRLERLNAEATPGPWWQHPGSGLGEHTGIAAAPGPAPEYVGDGDSEEEKAYDEWLDECYWIEFLPTDADAALVAAARSALPALLEVARAARRDVEGCAECKADTRGYCYRHETAGAALARLDALGGGDDGCA